MPSLTETLIECGVDVVGRTRFCVHPADKVKSIRRVGGTKGINWQKCAALEPALVIFDREENLKEMADACPYPWHATHITSVENIGSELRELSHKLANSRLAALADKWDALAERPNLAQIDWANVPGQIEPLANKHQTYKYAEYIIWRQPWMAVGRQTFIGSMLERLGFSAVMNDHKMPYPELRDEQMADPDTFYLFSSEPYPFAQHRRSLIDAGFNGAIVDGEVYSWFGIRSYRALAQYLGCED